MSQSASPEDKLKFDGLNAVEMDIRQDMPQFEKMNDVEIDVLMWGKGLQCV